MLKIENTEVIGWEHAIRGMRNPMNSWEKSDSFCSEIKCHECPDNQKCSYYFSENGCGMPYRNTPGEEIHYLGPNDHQLMMSLAKGGPVHAKYRRMITVYLDITAPLYWWKEFDTYKVGTVANSCSTMHKIHAKEFTLDDFSCEHLTDIGRNVLNYTIGHINTYRRFFVEWDKIDYNSKNAYRVYDKKDAWWQMIQLLPTSYNQKRTVMLNYEVLNNIYYSRRKHKLDEWHVFCDWIEDLPYSELIISEQVTEQ